jgi:hypothetical protein
MSYGLVTVGGAFWRAKARWKRGDAQVPVLRVHPRLAQRGIALQGPCYAKEEGHKLRRLHLDLDVHV